jgi:hypothetical protein
MKILKIVLGLYYPESNISDMETEKTWHISPPKLPPLLLKL